jgi:uncharacterized protein (DUF362 family)/Pyruvate/2-oxoacid:ferredoxin oxidoreductase delta subunit
MTRYAVALAQCPTYDLEPLRQALRKLLAEIGGLGAFVTPGQKVLIKPNLLAPRPPESAITTHPALIRAIAELVKEQGAYPYVGDSPGGFGVLQRIESLWEITGMKQAAADSGAQLVNFEKSPLKEIELRAGKKTVKIHIAACVQDDFDVIINVPKFKTHSLTITTGAIKNMFGVMPGLTKVYFHKIGPRKEEMSALLVALFAQVTPQLNIMDGIIGMEGEGPGSTGTPIQTGFLLAAANALALDMVQARLMEIPFDQVPILVQAVKAGLGPENWEKIDLLGGTLTGIKPARFDRPATSYMDRVPAFIVPVLSYLSKRVHITRPVVDEELCTVCQICLKNCPVKTIQLKKGRIRVDYKKCIECFCCLELCPAKAMKIKKSWVLKLAERKG